MHNTPLERATAEISAIGMRSPVEEKTWLTLMSFVAFRMPERIRERRVSVSCSSGARDTVSMTAP